LCGGTQSSGSEELDKRVCAVAAALSVMRRALRLGLAALWRRRCVVTPDTLPQYFHTVYIFLLRTCYLHMLFFNFHVKNLKFKK
jgi:hypothetical protein